MPNYRLNFWLSGLALLLGLAAIGLYLSKAELGADNSGSPDTHGASLERLYLAPAHGTQTRWITGENPEGRKGAGGTLNRGAKGRAFVELPPGGVQTIFDLEGPGIITRIWITGTFARDPVQRRMVRIDMYWDHETKPAVSAPIGDFFGIGLGELVPFESALFASPEGRSFNSFVPIPVHKAGRIDVTNDGPYHAMLYYEVDYLRLETLPRSTLYFHAYWSRTPDKPEDGDFEILPRVQGRGRYIGVNIGVVGNPAYRGGQWSWFGEGEVKVFLEGDRELPTLVGTGTEDYIGTGWGQGAYDGQYFGSPVADPETERYAFYRHHIPDPVYFHEDIRVTIQMMGNVPYSHFVTLWKRGIRPTPVFVFGLPEDIYRMTKSPGWSLLLDMNPPPTPGDETFPTNGSGVNFWRSGDDISATAYFYIDRPFTELPALAGIEVRTAGISSVGPDD